MEVERYISQSKISGEYETILNFEFDPHHHTRALKGQRYKGTQLYEIPTQTRILKPEIEKILLKKFQIIRNINPDHQEISNILNIILVHRIRFIAHIIVSTLGPRYIEDFFGHSVLKFYKIIRNYNPWCEYSVATYLYVCISRDLISNIKRYQRCKQDVEEDLSKIFIEQECPFHHTDAKYLSARILNGSKLTKKQISILDRIFVHDLNTVEIGKADGISRQAVSNRYVDALNKMKKYVNDHNIIYHNQ